MLVDKNLARSLHASTLTSLEIARTGLHKKLHYLVTFVEPVLPDEAIEPEVLIEILTIFFATLLTYAIDGLIWAAIKDHMRK